MNSELDWMPSTTLAALRARARLYNQIRSFFSQREVLEVDVPVLAAAATSDPNISTLTTVCCEREMYMQTSPEFAMKRLLAAGSGSIYYMGKAFRQGEAGSRHNPEFTMLEWYRPGMDEHQLMDEVEQLIETVLDVNSVERLSYRAIFQRHLGIDPHRVSTEKLEKIAKSKIDVDWSGGDRDIWLDLLVSHCIEPALGDTLTFIYDYPETQAALARIEQDEQGQNVARRFEAFYKGVELANGYWELVDAQQQRTRFETDQKVRIDRGAAMSALRLAAVGCLG